MELWPTAKGRMRHVGNGRREQRKRRSPQYGACDLLPPNGESALMAGGGVIFVFTFSRRFLVAIKRDDLSTMGAVLFFRKIEVACLFRAGVIGVSSSVWLFGTFGVLRLLLWMVRCRNNEFVSRNCVWSQFGAIGYDNSLNAGSDLSALCVCQTLVSSSNFQF